MLTKECRELLTYLRNCHYDTSPKSIPDNMDEIFSSSTSSEINEILNYLYQEGYITLKRYIDGSNEVELTHKGMHFEEFNASINAPASSQHVYNFNAPVNNSAVGNTGTVTINNGLSYDEARAFIDTKDISLPDKENALKVVDYIETLTENDAPLKKGVLTKFGDIISKHSWLPDLIGKLLLKYFTGM